MLELADGNPLLRLTLEDTAQNVVEVIRQWQDGLQEVRVLEKSSVGGILMRCLFPRVASTSKVD